ncbi:MAG TPA: carboxypeptidase-like regulatory domain-containing protein [Bacteroidales bacterium]|nr:carboxypeptidase-like regulatory domain-containing protein [Bacteroidales bacterium]HPT02710.1 carboxypeptidase-like regulatory domain-containing protein [Bacteroidales bacterium]
MNRKYAFIIALLMATACAQAQHRDDGLVQFSGVIVTADSLRPVPFTHILVEKTNRGTTSDYFGFFSIVVHKKDIIHFSAVGFKKVEFRIPDTLSENRYSLIQVMTSDTIMLAETVIYPWPTKEQFRQAFIKLDVPDDDLEIMRKNLAYLELRDRRDKNYNPDLYGMDAAMNYRNYVDNYTNKMYYAGQAMPNSLLDPLAWLKFIKAWKRGDFKKKY